MGGRLLELNSPSNFLPARPMSDGRGRSCPVSVTTSPSAAGTARARSLNLRRHAGQPFVLHIYPDTHLCSRAGLMACTNAPRAPLFFLFLRWYWATISKRALPDGLGP